MLKISKLFDCLICIEYELSKELKIRNNQIKKLDSEMLISTFELKNEDVITSKLDNYYFQINNLLKETNDKIKNLLKIKIEIEAKIAKLSFKKNKKIFILQKLSFIKCFEPIFNKYPLLDAFQIINRPFDPEEFEPYHIKWYFSSSFGSLNIVKEEVCGILKSFIYDGFYLEIIKNNLLVTKGKLYKNYDDYLSKLPTSVKADPIV